MNVSRVTSSQFSSTPIWRRAKKAIVVVSRSAGRGSDGRGLRTAAMVRRRAAMNAPT